MPQLTVSVFEERHLALVRDFHCGFEPWERQVSDWIRGTNKHDNAIRAMKKDAVKVWVFFDDEDTIIGFVSLGVNKLRYPYQSAKPAYFNWIPCIGIRQAYQGYPPNAPPDERYSAQIMDHVIAAALETEVLPLIWIEVDKRNEKAMHVASKAGFVHYPEHQPDFERGRDFCRMIIALTNHLDQNDPRRVAFADHVRAGRLGMDRHSKCTDPRIQR